MKRFLSWCARLPSVVFSVGVASLLSSLAVSAHAELMFIGDLGENTITAVATNATSFAPASRLLDGSGMFDLTAGRVTMDSKAYKDNWTQVWLSDYGGQYGTNGSVLFNFENNTSLEAMVIWNLSDSGAPTAYGRGVQLVTISYSTGTDTSGEGSVIFNGSLAEAVWSGTYTGTGYQNNINGLTAQNVKAVKMAYTANYGSGDYIGLSEVRFVGTAVPEPSTYVIAGLSSVGLAGTMRWRKRRAAKSRTGAMC